MAKTVEKSPHPKNFDKYSEMLRSRKTDLKSKISTMGTYMNEYKSELSEFEKIEPRVPQLRSAVDEGAAAEKSAKEYVSKASAALADYGKAALAISKLEMALTALGEPGGKKDDPKKRKKLEADLEAKGKKAEAMRSKLESLLDKGFSGVTREITSALSHI